MRPSRPPTPPRAAPQSVAGEHENIRLAVGQLAGFPPVRRSLARSRASSARTVRYLWIAIRGFIGIGRILRDTPARIVCALIICRLRRGIRAPRCHRWYRSSRPRIFTTLHLEKSRSACASILPSSFSPRVPNWLFLSRPFVLRAGRLFLHRRDATIPSRAIL